MWRVCNKIFSFGRWNVIIKKADAIYGFGDRADGPLLARSRKWKSKGKSCSYRRGWSHVYIIAKKLGSSYQWCTDYETRKFSYKYQARFRED